MDGVHNTRGANEDLEQRERQIVKHPAESCITEVGCGGGGFREGIGQGYHAQRELGSAHWLVECCKKQETIAAMQVFTRWLASLVILLASFRVGNAQETVDDPQLLGTSMVPDARHPLSYFMNGPMAGDSDNQNVRLRRDGHEFQRPSKHPLGVRPQRSLLDGE
jgi:hypothetical protein